MSTHSCNHSTPHTHAAEASHSHGNAPLRNYLVGVILLLLLYWYRNWSLKIYYTVPLFF